MKSEAKIQYEIVKWFNNTYCLKFHNPRYAIFSVPNESKNKMETIYKKSMGLKSGVSDLIVLMEKKCIFVEVKTESGRQSASQKDFEAQVKSLGFEYYVVRSLEDFKKIFL